MAGKLKVGVVGAAGRMGRMLVTAVTQAEDTVLSGATEPAGSTALGRDAGTLAGVGPLDVAVVEAPVPVFAAADAIVDFTTPPATARHAVLAAQARCALVVGTTGLSADQEANLERAAKHTAIVWAPNMSLGVNLLFALTEQVAGTLDPDYDIEGARSDWFRGIARR